VASSLLHRATLEEVKGRNKSMKKLNPVVKRKEEKGAIEKSFIKNRTEKYEKRKEPKKTSVIKSQSRGGERMCLV